MKPNRFLTELLADPQVNNLLTKLKELSRQSLVLPSLDKTLRAFELTDLDQVKVVIFGQDPYHQPGVADGLAFSSQQPATPASLKNIFTELRREYPELALETNDLTAWARQGVLLLNSALSVVAHQPNAHAGLGWDYVITKTVQYINTHLNNVVFMLWGRQAQRFAPLIDRRRHHVLTAAHPSPLSAAYGFFGCGHFFRANELLIKSERRPIDWNLKRA